LQSDARVANIEVLQSLPKSLDNSMNWEMKFQLTQLIAMLAANKNIQTFIELDSSVNLRLRDLRPENFFSSSHIRLQ
jgi:hypothetical protein